MNMPQRNTEGNENVIVSGLSFPFVGNFLFCHSDLFGILQKRLRTSRNDKMGTSYHDKKGDFQMKLISHIIFLVVLSLASCAKQPDYPEPERIGSDVVINISSLKPAVPGIFHLSSREGQKYKFLCDKY